jgi:hypothetical protein
MKPVRIEPAAFGRGFGRANLFQMHAFHLAYREIVPTASGESPVVEGPKNVQMAKIDGVTGHTAIESKLPRR